MVRVRVGVVAVAVEPRAIAWRGTQVGPIPILACALLAACSSAPHSGPSSPDSSAPDAIADAVPDADIPPTPVPLPGGASGIGFDDLRYAPVLKRILAPAGRTGDVELVDPITLATTPVGAFTASASFMVGAHDSGSTSADEGLGQFFAIDHETMSVRVVDSSTLSMVGSTALAGAPDYVRWVSSTGEIWITEPDTGLEVLTAVAGAAAVHAATIPVPGGPEGIAVDNTRHRVYTNSFSDQTYAIDVVQRAIVETWPNTCSGPSLGLALDEGRGFLFVACLTGSIVVLDAAHAGAKLGSVAVGAGLDSIAYSPSLHHVYAPGGASATLGIVAISSAGAPSLLGSTPTAQGATCVTTDDRAHAFVCDPRGGRLLYVPDRYPMTP